MFWLKIRKIIFSYTLLYEGLDKYQIFCTDQIIFHMTFHFTFLNTSETLAMFDDAFLSENLG